MRISDWSSDVCSSDLWWSPTRSGCSALQTCPRRRRRLPPSSRCRRPNALPICRSPSSTRSPRTAAGWTRSSSAGSRPWTTTTCGTCCVTPTRAATVSRANSSRCCCTSSTTRPTTAARQQRCCRRQAWTSASPTCWRWSRTPAQATPRLRASTEEPPMQLHAKRVYLAAEPEDGTRILVDRLWPRGLSKEKLGDVAWVKDVAPSDGLRKWFGHDPAKWDGFRQRYFAQLAAKIGSTACRARELQYG